jgi:hypothetical protein
MHDGIGSLVRLLLMDITRLIDRQFCLKKAAFRTFFVSLPMAEEAFFLLRLLCIPLIEQT